MSGQEPSHPARAAFFSDHSNDIHLINLTIETSSPGQAEGLLMTGEHNILSHVNVIGAGDAIQLNGTTYIIDSTVDGTGDTILGRGPTFWEHSTLRSTRVFMWIRNTDANHGNVFKDCTFIGTGRARPTLARSPGSNTPHLSLRRGGAAQFSAQQYQPRGLGRRRPGRQGSFLGIKQPDHRRRADRRQPSKPWCGSSTRTRTPN